MSVGPFSSTLGRILPGSFVPLVMVIDLGLQLNLYLFVMWYSLCMCRFLYIVLKGHQLYWLVCVCALSHVRLFAIPWTVAHQAALSIGFFRQEYWSRLPFPSPGDLPDAGIEPCISCISCIGRQILYHCTTWEAQVYPSDLSLSWLHLQRPFANKVISQLLEIKTSAYLFWENLSTQYTII